MNYKRLCDIIEQYIVFGDKNIISLFHYLLYETELEIYNILGDENNFTVYFLDSYQNGEVVGFKISLFRTEITEILVSITGYIKYDVIEEYNEKHYNINL